MSKPTRPDLADFAQMLGFKLQPWQRALAAHLEANRDAAKIAPAINRGDAWRALKARFRGMGYADGGYVSGPVQIDGIPARLSPPFVAAYDLADGADQHVEIKVTKDSAGQIKIVGRKWWIESERRWVTDAEMILPDETPSEDSAT